MVRGRISSLLACCRGKTAPVVRLMVTGGGSSAAGTVRLRFRLLVTGGDSPAAGTGKLRQSRLKLMVVGGVGSNGKSRLSCLFWQQLEFILYFYVYTPP